MSDPRNVAHAKKVTQEKKHQGTATQGDAPVAQPGKKSARNKGAAVDVTVGPDDTAAGESVVASQPPAALEASLVVLAKLKELEFHSRANLERLAELTLTVEDELKQKEFVGPLGEVYSAQGAFQTKLTTLLDAYKSECERMQGQSA